MGGMEVLVAMEKVETDEKDRPCEEVRVQTTSVFTDPFEEAEEEVYTHTAVHTTPVIAYTVLPGSCWQRRRKRGKPNKSPAPVPLEMWV